MADISDEQLENIREAAWRAAQAGNLVEAHQHAQALVDQGLEGGYQLKSMLYLEEEDLEQAINLVNQGAEQLPQSWSMRLLQADMLSIANQGEQALKILEEARNLPEAESHWIDIGEATVHGRMVEIDKALNLLQSVEHPDAINSAMEMQFALMDSVGRHDLIIEVAEEDLDLLQAPRDGAEAAILSRIMTQVGQAYWYEEEDNDAVEHFLKLAIAYDRTNPDALYLRRELDELFSEKSLTYELELKGILSQPNDEGQPTEMVFRAHYQIIADSEDEALAFIRQYEPEDIASAEMSILSVNSEANEEEELKGIYVVSPLAEA